MTEMVTSGSMSGEGKRSDGLLGESDNEKTTLALGAAGPVRHRAPLRLYRPKSLLQPFTITPLEMVYSAGNACQDGAAR